MTWSPTLSREQLSRWSRASLARIAADRAETLVGDGPGAEHRLTLLLLYVDVLEREALAVAAPPPFPLFPSDLSSRWARSVLASLALVHAATFTSDSPHTLERRAALLELAAALRSPAPAVATELRA